LGEGQIRVAGATLVAACRMASLEKGDKLQFGFRPEHIALVCDGTDTIRARVDFSEYLGGTRFLYCQLDDGQNVIAEYRDGMDVAPGDILHLAIAPERRRYFSAAGQRLR
jgi:lactose/L-arabinose transport system ATP-binding protein